MREGPRIKDMPVEIVDHDPNWPSLFEEERRVLQQVLSPWLDGGIHHVGSTAVEGLAAKPVIDIMAGVADLDAAREAVPALEGVGYLFWEWDPHPWRLWFLKPEPAHRTHHLHLVQPDHPEFQAKLAFRNRLRKDAAVRDRYEHLKRQLASRHPQDRDAYTDGKTEFVLSVLADLGLAEGVPPRNYREAREQAGVPPGELPPEASR